MTGEQVVVAACCALLAGIAGWFTPRVLARLPEPEDADPDKPAYITLARTSGLAGWTAGCSAVVAGSIGAVLGADWSLPVWVYLSVVGVALAFID